MDLKKSLSKYKPLFLNIFMILLFIAYGMCGGLIFYLLEGKAGEKSRIDRQRSIINCTYKILITSTSQTVIEQAKGICKFCVNPRFPDHQWNLTSGIVYALAHMATVGYGRLELLTLSGRLFHIFFCIIGMPLGLLVLANLGKFIEEAIVWGSVKWTEKHKLRQKTKVTPPINKSRRPSAWDKFGFKKNENNNNDEPNDGSINGYLLLLIFVIYICIGVTFYTIRKETHLINGLFFNFMSLTAVDASEFIVINDVLLLPITLIYLTGGLALATIAIGFMSKYLKRVHNLGKKLKGTGKILVWFGDKTLTVKNVILAVGNNWGVDETNIDDIDIDKIVDQKIVEEEKKKKGIAVSSGNRKKGPKFPMTQNLEIEGLNLETKPRSYPEWRRLGVRRHIAISYGPELRIDPIRLYQIYQKEWKRRTHFVDKATKNAWLRSARADKMDNRKQRHPLGRSATTRPVPSIVINKRSATMSQHRTRNEVSKFPKS